MGKVVRLEPRTKAWKAAREAQWKRWEQYCIKRRLCRPGQIPVLKRYFLRGKPVPGLGGVAGLICRPNPSDAELASWLGEFAADECFAEVREALLDAPTDELVHRV